MGVGGEIEDASISVDGKFLQRSRLKGGWLRKRWGLGMNEAKNRFLVRVMLVFDRRERKRGMSRDES